MTGQLAFLAWGAICAAIGAASTAVFFLWREEKAARARQAEVDVEFAPTLDRVRPVIEVANHQPPPRVLAGTGRRHGLLARALLAAAGIADLIRGVNTRQAPAGQRRDFPNLDRNSPAWPVNPPPVVDVPAVQVGRVALPADFEGWVRSRNAELHARLTDPDSTGFIPRITAEVAQ
ncbi:hypothetical protein ABZY58_12135 [Micromonospora tulbaghiae]|uniref:hypothetical protein n=1 Tax=Micromonospora tulbaghiae TaxID=479978 RepID=UPI0033A0E5FA